MIEVDEFGMTVSGGGGGGGETSRAITTVSGTAFVPQHRGIYKHILAASDALSIDTSGFGADAEYEFDIWLVQPSTAVAFTWPEGIYWWDGTEYSTENSAPTCPENGGEYFIPFFWTGANLCGGEAKLKEAASPGPGPGPVSSTVVVTGACNTNVNGTYTIVDSSATGKARKWYNSATGMWLVNGSVASISINQQWIFSTAETVDNMSVQYYADNASYDNPWNVTSEHWFFVNSMPPSPTVAEG